MNVTSIGRGLSAFGSYVGKKASAVGQKVSSVFSKQAPLAADTFAKTAATPDVSKVAKLVKKYEAFPKLKQVVINGALKLVPEQQKAKFLDALFGKKFSTVLEKLEKGRIPHAEYRKMVQSFNSRVEQLWFGKTANRMLDERLKNGNVVNADALTRILDFIQDIGSHL